MGNICGTQNSTNVYNPPASPISGTASSSQGASNRGLTSIHQLRAAEREIFLNIHDPMRKFNLDPDTPVYRTMDRKYIDKKGRVGGHPDSGARIALYEQLKKNPIASHIGATPGQARYYTPKEVRASELKDPSLNVMVGPRAHESRHYGKKGDVTVEMRLGDFLDHGGKVYTDTLANGTNGETNAIIVTLPKGKKVPATVVREIDSE